MLLHMLILSVLKMQHQVVVPSSERPDFNLTKWANKQPMIMLGKAKGSFPLVNNLT